MKASLKLREDQNPLLRAKIPIRILGLPFVSGVSACDARELRLDLATAFDSGPSFRVSYRPNDPSNPFSLSVRTGVGAYGSPAGAPMSISAEFNLLSRAGSGPGFSILFKPRLGDFSLKKSIKSSSAPPPQQKTVEDSDLEPAPAVEFRPQTGTGSLISGVDLTASSALPLREGTSVRFRWGAKLPAQLRTALVEKDRTAGMLLGRLPFLVMSKISIEHVAQDEKPKAEREDVTDGADVGCSWALMRRQLEALREENTAVAKVVEEIHKQMGSDDCSKVVGQLNKTVTRGETHVSKSAQQPTKKTRGESDASKGRTPEYAGKAAPEDVSEELRKALMGAGAGI